MKNIRIIIDSIIVLILISSFSACGGTPSPTTPVIPPPATSQPPTQPGPVGVPALSPTATVVTAGQLAIAGQIVYAKSCTSCHGAQGQGGKSSALIGTGSNKTAAGLYQSISTTMPMNAPGSLSSQDYLNVMSYLVVQNNLVKNKTPISAGQLDSIKLQ